MKLESRQTVEGTEPAVSIGKPLYRDRKTGQLKTCKNWYAEFRHGGRQHVKNLQTDDRKTAIKKVWKLLSRLEEGLEESLPWSELLKRFLARLEERQQAPTTVQKYRAVLEGFVAFVAAQCHDPAKLSPKQFWSYYADLAKKVSPKTQFDYAMIVRGFTKWCAAEKLWPTNPLSVTPLPDDPGLAEQAVFTAEQVALILAAAPGEKKAIFALMAYAGLRFGEVRDLEWKDLLLDKGTHGLIHVRRGGSRPETTKGKANRVIPIHPALRPHLDKLPKSGARLFGSPTGGLLGERGLLAFLKRLCRRLKIKNAKELTLHSFRHTFASELAKAGVKERYALDFMGHKSSAVLDGYVKLYDQTATGEMAKVAFA